MAAAWPTSVSVFGDLITIEDVDYDCVIHQLGSADGVARGRPGRTQSAEGQVVMARTDWIASAASKGARINLGDFTYRVNNDPLATATSDTVTLDIGPIT